MLYRLSDFPQRHSSWLFLSCKDVRLSVEQNQSKNIKLFTKRNRKTYAAWNKGTVLAHLESSSPLSPLEGDVVPSMKQTERWRGCGWMEVPCHETVILSAIKLTSIHYWKWLPTLQTHLGECAVIREFVDEGPECLTTTLSTTVRETEI